MFSLQLFGGASILASGQPLSGPVTQRRRLALLALLAVPAGRSLTRDKVIACLWPESDSDRARHLLSESLYVIRKALGEEAVLAAGDDLRLNPQLITSDVGEFEAAFAQGELQRAVALYAGPFLDGFYVSENPEFERWVEGERTRLARCYQKALEGLAAERESAGDLGGAVEAWRQLLQQDPFSARVVLALMRALEAVGDRAGALQHARVHELLLREEFGAEPDPEVAALAERLRREPVARPAALPPLPLSTASEEGAPATETRAAEEQEAPVEPAAAGTPAIEGEEAREPRTEAAELPFAAPLRTPRPSRRTLVHAAAALLLVVVGAGLLESRRPGGVLGGTFLRAAATAETRSIAVLPFADLSEGKDQEYFSDGITEDILAQLAKIADLTVISRTSAMQYKQVQKGVREIASELGVAHLVEGSVRRLGDRVRINAQLIDARTDRQLWAESYERELSAENLFQIQSEIAQQIAGALHTRLSRSERERIAARPTEDLTAYDLYLQGRYYWHQRSADGLARGMQRFQQAIEQDPTFALGYAGLADSYALLVGFGALAPHEGYPQARAAAERALALDSTLAEAHASRALVRLYYEWDWEGADGQFQRALQLSPGNATLRQWYGHYLACRGETEAALAQMRRAQELDPLSPVLHTAEGHLLYYARRYDDAAAKHRHALAMAPQFWLTHVQLAAVYLRQDRTAEAIAQAAEASRLAGGHPLPTAILGYSYALAGRRPEALEILATLEQQGKRQYVSPAFSAAIHLGLEDHNAAFHWLEKAYEAHDDWMVFIRVDPVFDALRSDPRFSRLLARVEAAH